MILVAAACGGSHKSTTPPPTLPPEAKAEPAPPPAPPPAPAKPVAPPVPQGPLEMSLPAPQVTVKLVSPGKGKRAALKLATKQGAKQSVDIAMDFSGKQTAPAELGGAQEQVAPTVVLTGDLEAQDVAKDGATKFQLTITGVDAKDKEGAKESGATFKQNLTSLAGMTIAGTVNANGTTSDLSLHLDKPDEKSEGAMGLVKLSLMPMWPVLPAVPVGVGAKWQVTEIQKVADRLVVTQTVDYELTGHKGTAWTIKGTAKVTGADQEIEKAKFSAIGGNGTAEVTLTDGALAPATKVKLVTDFTASANAGGKDVSLVFHLEQSNAVAPK